MQDSTNDKMEYAGMSYWKTNLVTIGTAVNTGDGDLKGLIKEEVPRMGHACMTHHLELVL